MATATVWKVVYYRIALIFKALRWKSCMNKTVHDSLPIRSYRYQIRCLHKRPLAMVEEIKLAVG
jgi:hypothetical protein